VRKRRAGARQVWVRKTNGSEPLRTCRKASRRHRNRDRRVAREEPRRGPADDLGGVRHEGGGSLTPALLRNVGTCRPDAKGTPQGSRPSERGGTEAGHRGRVPRSSEEAGESRGAKGARQPAPTVGQLATGGADERGQAISDLAAGGVEGVSAREVEWGSGRRRCGVDRGLRAGSEEESLSARGSPGVGDVLSARRCGRS
jgi:hypothetical protein